MAPIHDAVYLGDAEAVAGVGCWRVPDLHEANVSPLNMAVDLGRIEIIMLLVEAGADVDLRVDTFTPLHIACIHGCKARVAALLAAGASASILRETPGLKQGQLK